MNDEPDSLARASSWRPGDRLTLRGGDWTVLQRTAYADCEALRLEDPRGPRSRTFLLPFDRPRRLDRGRTAVLSARAWLHAFERLLFDVHFYGGLHDCTSAIDIVPYQLEPALAMLRDGHPRLLIADAVGMGKTIEAGLILRGLLEGQDGFRALILVPAGLRQQWCEELAARFHVPAVAADAAWLRTMGRSLPGDVNPWSLPGIYLASFDFIKRPEALRPLEDVQWDLLIVDEAHAAAVATDRRAAVDAVALRSLRVILLTATPPQDALQFAALCRIGAVTGGPDVVKFQRVQAAGRARRRRSAMLAARISDEERRMHRMLERYTTLVWRDARRLGNAQGRLATVILRKRALSSAASLEASLRRRRDFLAGICAPPELQLVLPLDDEDEDGREDLVADGVLASSGLHNPASEQRWLSALIAAAAAVSDRDAKARVLVRLLRRIRQPAIVFTEYRDTLERLRLRLVESDLPSCVLHGGLSTVERRDVLAEFARGRSTLLATDAAAEGLNLQRTCRVIVHYELPWNPSRMLQRAGRVDRIGQRRRVHEIALVASDTAESLVLAPLVRRAAGWRTSGGTARMLELLTESRVAEVVFEGAPPDAPAQPAIDAPCVSVALESEAAGEAHRLQGRRAILSRLRSSHAKPARADVVVTTLERCSLAPGVVLLFNLTILRRQLDVVARSVAAVHVSLALPEWPRRPSRIKERLTAMLPALLAAVSPVVGELGQAQLDAVRQRFLEAQTRARLREREVAGVHASAARQLVQAGLFERPPQRTATARAAIDLLEAAGRQTPACVEANQLTPAADLRAVLVVLAR